MTQQETKQSADEQHDAEKTVNRGELNAANEKLLEDQLGVSEDKIFDYVPGEN
ncbi:hypothetical protein ACFQ88_28980 [Paenibacillus sp. NPDC056579]|uniref:hypothetical protein n=1 Tax=unclassified Paenibacillus TaxID=185978 RepID=UPI001EF94EDE|nr:hypothetical protein [Paenibacillus sp. H1-7]